MSKAKQKNSGPKTVSVDIVSDIVCPWCWLGSRYFQQAAEKSPHKVEVVWRPYMLDPNVPEGGMAYGDYMKAKFGGGPNDRFTAMRKTLEAAAPDAGIHFRFSDIPMRPNTLGAHRLMKWAGGQNKAAPMAESLFKAFFDDLKDVGDPAILAALASEAGMDKDLTTDLLAGDKDKQSVLEEIAFFQRLGVTGVPCFIYGGQFAVQGAQPPEAHLQAIEKAAKLPETH